MSSTRSIAAGRGHVEIGIKNRVAQGAKSIEKSLDRIGQRMTGLGKIATATGLAVATPLAFAAKKFADFDDTMRSVGAVSQASASDLLMLTDTAKELGRTTSFTAVQVGELMVQLGRAGFSARQVDRMTESVLNLARATGTDATLAANTMASTIRQFNLQAGDASRVADVLTSAANKSFNTVEALGEALTYAGPVAADFNMSLEETAAVLGTLGNIGIQASNAGTVVRRLLTLTGADAKKLERIFDVSFVDASGNARPLVDALGKIDAATKSLGTGDRAAKFNEAFGLLGITGASALSRAAGDTRKLYQEIKTAGGIAEDTAKQMDDGLGGSFRKIASAAEGVQVAVGDAFDGTLMNVVDHMTGALGIFTQFIDRNQGLVQAVAIGAGGLTVMGGGLLGLGVAAQATSFAIGGVITTVGLLTSPIALATAGVAGLGYALATQTEIGAKAVTYLKESFGPLVDSVQTAIGGVKAALASGDIEAAWQITMDALELLWIDMTSGIRDTWNALVNTVLDAGVWLAEGLGETFVALGDFLESLLKGYESYYNKVYNMVVEAGGKMSGVRTIGETGNAFEADFGGVKEGLLKSFEGMRNFGEGIKTSAKGHQADRYDRTYQAINEREKRRRELAAGIDKKSGDEVAEVNQMAVEAGATQMAKVLGDTIGNALGFFGGLGSSNTGSASQRGGGLSLAGGQGATFSATGAILLGNGVGVDERTAKANEKQVTLLEQISEKLGLDGVAATTEKATNLAIDAAAGLADIIAGQDIFKFGKPDPSSKSNDESGGKKQTGLLEQIAENTKNPPPPRYAG